MDTQPREKRRSRRGKKKHEEEDEDDDSSSSSSPRNNNNNEKKRKVSKTSKAISTAGAEASSSSCSSATKTANSGGGVVYCQEEVESVLPQTTSEYRIRLVKQKADMYKDPPMLPPPFVTIDVQRGPQPRRNKSNGTIIFDDYKDEEFTPNRTPEEVLRAGSFGGTYFRPITSSVTNIHYNSMDVLRSTVDPTWITNLPTRTYLTSTTYNAAINKYGVKCGGSLGMWESSGWITNIDPYGWFQWYCRFYRGRRSSDDLRQISRWKKSVGPRGRFRSQLCNKVIAANVKATDGSISPVIRQTLLHWGLELTEEIVMKHRKRIGKC